MSISPVERAATQRIGSVEYVAPNEIKIVLDLEAPDGISANAGILPRTFPRVNGYVLIATEAGYLVAQVEWIAVERSPFPKRKGFHDFGLVDLPFPLRKMRANPLGVLQSLNKQRTGESLFEFKRGVQSFPSVGEPVLIPTDNQLRAIIESGKNRHVKIGISPLAANAEVKIDPNRLFGRHLAILGNTGSGKSCSVAGLIQWCLDEAGKNCEKRQPPNARFIILDPNGEYSRVFNSRSRQKARVFQVGADDFSLQVPIWFWNSAEWCSIMQASAKAQAPLLRRALRSMRNEEFEVSADINIEIKRFLGNILQSCIESTNNGEPYKRFPHPKNFTERLEGWKQSIDQYSLRIEPHLQSNLTDISYSFQNAITNHKIKKSNDWVDYPIYNVDEISSLIKVIRNGFIAFGGTEQDLLPKHEDIPVKFSSDVFVNFLSQLAQETGNEQYLDFLITIIRTMLSDIRMKEIIGDQANISLEDCLAQYIDSDKDDTDITIIDLSLVPSEIIHIVTAVVARMVFEALQRYRKLDKDRKTLPTVLVAEEAHTFIKRYKEDVENKNAYVICTQVFERIAREGRKFGLGLLLASQRPSELSPTVLSQCNSFLLHRISNDKDQELVNRLVPDNLRGLFRELPSLPSQYAILLGWATELPVLVRMNDLKKEEQPYSSDPEFWNVWIKQEERIVDWKPIAEDWQMKNNIELDDKAQSY
jgi:DNA helicase HerA-like ATPase